MIPVPAKPFDESGQTCYTVYRRCPFSLTDTGWSGHRLIQ